LSKNEPRIKKVEQKIVLMTKVNSFIRVVKIKPKPNLSLYSPYYAEACNEFAVPNSAS